MSDNKVILGTDKHSTFSHNADFSIKIEEFSACLIK